MTNTPNTSPTSPNPTRSATWTALGLAWEFGYMIVIPLVVFGLAGRWLDRRLETSPWLLLAGMGLAIALTTVFMVRKFSAMIRQAEGDNRTSQP